MVAQFGVCIPANAMSNGIDSSALFPRYFNLTRGALVTCAFGFVIQPWQLLNGANQFLTVIGGYAVFLGPMTGVMFADYYIIRRRQLKLTSLYDFSDTSIYWYNKGFNWRAVVSWVLGVCLVLPGFVQWITDSSVELSGWSKMYYLAVSFVRSRCQMIPIDVVTVAGWLRSLHDRIHCFRSTLPNSSNPRNRR
jgi:NCS1 family nucleobase:cation symporter-1